MRLPHAPSPVRARSGGSRRRASSTALAVVLLAGAVTACSDAGGASDDTAGSTTASSDTSASTDSTGTIASPLDAIGGHESFDPTDHTWSIAKPKFDPVVEGLLNSTQEKNAVAFVNKWLREVAWNGEDMLATDVADFTHERLRPRMTPGAYADLLTVIEDVRIHDKTGEERERDLFDLQALTGYQFVNGGLIGDADTVKISPQVTRLRFENALVGRHVDVRADVKFYGYLHSRGRESLYEYATSGRAKKDKATKKHDAKHFAPGDTGIVFTVTNTLRLQADGPYNWRVHTWALDGNKVTYLPLPDSPAGDYGTLDFEKEPSYYS